MLVVHAHPVETSYCAALHQTAVDALARAGHDIEVVDLYGEDFEPRLSREERLAYHDTEANRMTVADHVERLLRAEALVMTYPVWNFGFPAVLKGYFDRVFLPGVSFRMEGGAVVPNLGNIRKLAAITTYGGSRFRAFLLGDPPRKIVTRLLRATIRPGAPVSYLAHYDMNRSTPESRARFLARVDNRMERF